MGREGNRDGEESDVAVGLESDNKAESGKAEEKAVGGEKGSKMEGLERAVLIRLDVLLIG